MWGSGPGRGSPLTALLAGAGLLLLLALGAMVWRGHTSPAKPVGLFTTLPILWRETGDIAELLDSDAPPHWALAVLRARGPLQPLDALADPGGRLPLERGALLVIAQPRPLSPQENVALDDWVRGGGRVLLFADPLLTAPSAFALGDRRRPQDIVLLSPILTRWGLALRFDDDQARGERTASLYGTQVPVDMPGSFSGLAGARGCRFAADGLAARCRVGRGEVLAIADAALLEAGSAQDVAAREAALARILASFPD